MITEELNGKKDIVLFEVWEEDECWNEAFNLELSKKEQEAILKFVKTFNKKLKYLNISINKEVYKDE